MNCIFRASDPGAIPAYLQMGVDIRRDDDLYYDENDDEDEDDDDA